MKRRKEAQVDPETKIANLTEDLRRYYHRCNEVEHLKRQVEHELACAKVTIEALASALVKERRDNDIPF